MYLANYRQEKCTYVECCKTPRRVAPLVNVGHPEIWVCPTQIDGLLTHRMSSIDDAEYTELLVESAELLPRQCDPRAGDDRVDQAHSDSLVGSQLSLRLLDYFSRLVDDAGVRLW